MSLDEARAPASHSSVAADLSREVVRLHAKLYGRGPTKARSYLHRDYAICVLEEVMTAADRTLVQHGSGDHVRDTRTKFHEAVREDFVRMAEAVTGRRVRAFLSQISLEEDLAVETFLFEPEELTDG